MEQEGRSRIYEKWSVSGFILKAELTRLADGLDMRYEEKNEKFSKVLGNSILLIHQAIN